MNNSFFGKTIENVRKRWDVNLLMTDKRDYLVSEPNYHTAKSFSKNLIAIEIKNKQTNIHE